MLKQIVRNIKLFRKAFLTDFIRIHYAQFGEDIILRELLKKELNDGFYVDVGCYHPKKFSNTYWLYKKGWSGINIDMEEDKIRLFNMVRRRDYNILCPVSNKRETVTLYRDGKYGLGSTLDKDLAGQITAAQCETVETKTLTEIIDDSPFRDRHIDVLSIDVEGMDYKVISALDFKKYKPKVIIIEDHHRNIEDIVNTDVYKLLKNNAYILRSWTFYSLIFILPGADILKDRENR